MSDPCGECLGGALKRLWWGGCAVWVACWMAGCQPAPVSPLEQALRGEGPYEIEIVGSEDRWLVRYPGQAEPVETAGEELLGLQLHVPAERAVRLALRSTDYIYTLELPAHQLKEIAVPKLVFYLDFQSGPPGRTPLVGDHLCRGVVEELQGNLIVEPVPELLQWLRSQAGNAGASAAGPDVDGSGADSPGAKSSGGNRSSEKNRAGENRSGTATRGGRVSSRFAQFCLSGALSCRRSTPASGRSVRVLSRLCPDVSAARPWAFTGRAEAVGCAGLGVVAACPALADGWLPAVLSGMSVEDGPLELLATLIHVDSHFLVSPARSRSA